jgi:hypothetical protein
MISFLMRLKFQKRSALKFVSRIILRAKLSGTSLLVELMKLKHYKRSAVIFAS